MECHCVFHAWTKIETQVSKHHLVETGGHFFLHMALILLRIFPLVEEVKQFSLIVPPFVTPVLPCPLPCRIPNPTEVGKCESFRERRELMKIISFFFFITEIPLLDGRKWAVASLGSLWWFPSVDYRRNGSAGFIQKDQLRNSMLNEIQVLRCPQIHQSGNVKFNIP